MKKRLTSFTTLFILALGCSTPRVVNSQDKKPQSPAAPAETATPADTRTSPQAQAMKGLRDRLFTLSPEELGLTGKDANAKVWGVLMEVTFSEGSATLVSVRDGTASLYTSTGGGILGGYNAQKEAKRFVVEAEKHLVSMKPAKSYPYPAAGKIKFYALTRDGVYATEVDEKEVQREGHTLFPLFIAGNEVLSALRTANESARP